MPNAGWKIGRDAKNRNRAQGGFNGPKNQSPLPRRRMTPPDPVYFRAAALMARIMRMASRSGRGSCVRI